MELAWQTFAAHKRFALTIARGTSDRTTNLWVSLAQDGLAGWGEASPFSTGHGEPGIEELVAECEALAPRLQAYHPEQRQAIAALLAERETATAVRAAIDTALHDWLGQRVQQPLWRLGGLERERIPPTSVTVGDRVIAGIQQRIAAWQQQLTLRRLKLKLGHPDGIVADRERLLAAQQSAPQAELYVDANGGWQLSDAIAMCDWLAERGVEYVEQPLAVGDETALAELSARSPLPLFADESCRTSRDVPLLADRVSGINIKLMKAGGLTEVVRMVHTARACGLQVMYGCYADSVLANTAMAQLSPLADYLDLDSHLNLVNDPFAGAVLQAGRLLPNERAGLGVTYRAPDG
ncbi:MAG: dipeptide epimerase [Cyanobacteria bacterium QS_8_64_29]|nr:MAG: dipeptide epimerase [Cyanobacteria bacterium QS_8_64_29]